MKKVITILIILNILSGLLFAQGTQRYTTSNPDRIAIFYFHCQDVPNERLISQEDLTAYFFGSNSPVRQFWTTVFTNSYHYTGEVFDPIEIPLTEEDFSPAQRGEALIDNIKEAMNGRLVINGFNEENFDKIIYLLGESSKFSAGEYRAFYDESSFDININGNEVSMPTLSCKGINFDEQPCFYADDWQRDEENKLISPPSNCYPVFKLWGQAIRYSLLHEWGHSLGMGHANLPCSDCNCDRYYESTCSGYFEFNTCRKDNDDIGHSMVEYGDVFDIMGGFRSFSMHFSAAMRDIAGLLPDNEKVVLNSNIKKWKITLDHLQKFDVFKRAAVIKIDKTIESPLIDIHRRDELQTKPTAKINLYAEYRLPALYDVNLKEPKLIKNTEGLMIRLALTDVNIDLTTYQEWGWESFSTNEYKEETEERYASKTWLLDMTPQDGRSTVTLNPGWEFYHDDWEVSIQNVHKTDDNKMAFGVEYGRKRRLGSGVYKTIFFPYESSESVHQPLLYSSGLGYKLEVKDGELTVSQNDNPDNITWKGSDYGIPVDPNIDKLSFNDGYLILTANDKVIFDSKTNGHPLAKLLITTEGKLVIVGEDGGEIWPTLKVETVKDTDGNVYSVKRMKDGKLWTTQNLKFQTHISPCYDKNESYCTQYGRLYTYEGANYACQQLGKGWRLPTYDEWLALFNQYGESIDANNYYSFDGTTAYSALIDGGTAGFNATLGGRFRIGEKYEYLGIAGFYWSSSMLYTAKGGGQYTLSQNNITFNKQKVRWQLGYPKLQPKAFNGKTLYSCRCIKD